MRRHCYAEGLGGCSGKLSLEHFISRSLLLDLEPTFTAEGLLPADPAVAAPASAASVASRVLCRTHNATLSEVDGAVVPFLSACRRFDQALNSTAVRAETAVVDGYMLERWLVKALLGLVARPGSTSTLSAAVHRLLVAVAFGKSQLAAPWGVHLDISLQRPMVALHDFSLVALVGPTLECKAITFSAASIRWLLALGQSSLPAATYRPHSVVMRSPVATRTLNLAWPLDTQSHMELRIDRQTFDSATEPEYFTPTGAICRDDLLRQTRQHEGPKDGAGG